VTHIEKERVEIHKEMTAISQEERIRVDEKRRREHSAVISDIPKEANADLERFDPNDIIFKRKRKGRLCCCCDEMATKIVSYDYDGAKLFQKYCIKHLEIFCPSPS